MNHATSIQTPIGCLTVSGTAEVIQTLEWTEAPQDNEATPLYREAAEQIRAYFSGRRKTFDLPLDPAGTDHQRHVWDEMLCIPFGQVKTYGDLSRAIGSSARAVGTACGRNPIPVIIPCHRVIAAGRGIGGYSGRGGLDTKRILLAHEGVDLNVQSQQGDLLEALRDDG